MNFSNSINNSSFNKLGVYLNQKGANTSNLQQNESVALEYQPAPPLQAKFHGLTSSDINSVEYFVFFVGYGRSGHSMVASLMDAHPDVIVAHEFFLFDKLSDEKLNKFWTKKELFNRLYFNSFTSAVRGWRANKRTSKGYNLNLKGSWQGQFRKLRVVGDKTAGATAMLYHTSAPLFKATLTRLHDVSGVALRAVHMVRNPYDMIATVALYQASPNPDKIKVKATREKPFKKASYVKNAMFNILNKAVAVQGIAKLSGLQLLEVHLEDLIHNSRDVILKICHFLEVTCDDEYVKMCQAKLYRDVSQSRHLVVWPDFVKKTVQRLTKTIPFFSRYTFEN